MKLRQLLVPLAAALIAASAVALPAIAGTVAPTKREAQLQTRLLRTTNAMLKARGDLVVANMHLGDARIARDDAKGDLTVAQAANAALQAQVTDLQGKLATAQTAATAQQTFINDTITRSQQGIATQIAAMDSPTAFALLPLIRARMSGHYSASVYTADGYQSYDFSWMSCC